MVLRRPLPEELADLVAAWTGCVAGALEENDYRDKLTAAGFVDVEIQPTRVFTSDDAREFLAGQHVDADRLASQLSGAVMSAFVRAVKP
jgi:hypothetical protein